MQDKNFPIYVLAFGFTLIFTVLLERALIPILLRRAKQPIYSEGPQWHEKKSGTPTMGGLAFLISITITLSASAVIMFAQGNKSGASSLLISLAFSVFNGMIGLFDDLKKLRKKENKGLSAKEKLILQTVAAVSFLVLREIFLDNSTTLAFSFGLLDAGVLYYPAAALLLVGLVNMANLTDGIDGLAGGVGFASAVSIFYISCSLVTESAFVSAAVIGGTLGFLFFNINPARIFMGDTGSLFLGALIVSSCFMLSNPLVTLAVNSVYIIEGLSVILQVLCFKLTGKRILKMAPLHHHLEKNGWSENKICFAAIILTLISSIPAYVLYTP